MAGAIAYNLGAAFIPLRKPDKLPCETYKVSYDLEYGSTSMHIHKDALNKQKRLLIIDDLLATGALMSIAFAINETKADIIYSDEDFIDINGAQTQPNFKPDYSPDLLLAHNYITHLVAVRRQLCIDAGGLRTGYDGAQDYDLLLRLTDDEKRSVHHIPEVLYHWRQFEPRLLSQH